MASLPEQQARQTIDAMLAAAGWAVQDYKAFDPSASFGIALREVPLKSGRCDYLLLVNRKPVGVVEMTCQSHEVARKTLNLEDARAASVALPPLAEQTRIVAEVERRLSVVEELEAVVTTNHQRAIRLQQAVLQKAFSGELVAAD